jgi:ribonucleoside-triphosphate reductase
MVNFLGTLQNEWAGAQAFSSFDTFLAPYVKLDKLSYAEVRQGIQQFVFNLNVPSRWGMQTPFTNITLDWNCPEDMREQHPIIGGKEQEFTYGKCQAEMDVINRAYIDVMSAGDSKGRIFTFPIPTYNITKDFDWDHENAQGLFEMTAKYGIPYFQNFVNSDLNPSDVRSMCCRLQLDLRQLKARGGGLFGSAEMTGSVGVVTINLPRIAYLSRTKQEFLTRLGELMDTSKVSLELKRKAVQENIDMGLLPFTKRYLPSLRNHFSTIGLNGMNEACTNLLGLECDIASEAGKQFAMEVLDFMRDKLVVYQEETGHLYNLEATPAEGTTYRFAKEDKKRFPEILQAGTSEAPYYTNSSHLPVGFTSNPLEALRHQDALQTRYTGGTVLHLFLGERIHDWKMCRDFVKKVIENHHLPYITVTPTFSVCQTHGYLSGEVKICPTCQSSCEVWSRVVGYFRPVQEWNKGKKSEYAEREEYLADSPETVAICV